MLTHANLTASCAIYDAWFNPQSSVKPGEARVICALPLFHIFAMSTVMLRNLSNGNEVLLRPKFDVETTFHDIEVKRATHMNGVPTMWIALCNAGIETRDLSSLVGCSSGGAALPVEVEQRFEALTGKRLRSGIGMTETSPAASTQPVGLARQAGVVRGAAARHLHRRRGARRSASRPRPGRNRRNPHQGPQCRERLLEPAGGVRRDFHRRLLPVRRYRLHGRGRLCLGGRPQEGHRHLRRLQRLSARGRGSRSTSIPTCRRRS